MRMKMFTLSAICELVASDIAADAALIFGRGKKAKLSGGACQ